MMKVYYKKIISFILAFTLIFGIGAAGLAGFSTITASAADATEYTEDIYRYTVSDGSAKITDVVGIIGDVTLPSTLGGYTVTGIGEAAFKSETGLVNVVIPAEIETVENSAFYSCGALKTVTFEGNSKLKSLGSTAFTNCFVLKSVDFGENSVLESIGGSAFVNCKVLDNIDIPGTVKTIGSSAFEGCLSLSEITIPAAVTAIGSYAFSNCESLEKIVVSNGNQNYISDEWGIVYNKEKTKIVCYPAGNKRTVYVVPDYITEIESAAFKGAKNLEELTWINCDMKIGTSAFSDCVSLYRVTVPEGTTYLSDWIFNGCLSLTEVNLPESLEVIGCGVFHLCTGLEHIELPSGLKSISDNAFKECESLKSIVLPEGMQKIYPRAFEKCFSLESVYIPNSVDYVGSTAFYQCCSLKEIRFPEGLKKMDEDVVRYCFALEDITIPDSMENIYAGAFEDCRSLKTVSIPQNVKTITGEAFVNCTAFESVAVDEENAAFYAGTDGVLFSKDKTKLVYYPANKADKVYAVPETVTAIGAYAFTNAQNTATLIIPDSVAQIEANAFNGFNIRDIYFEGSEDDWNAFAASADTAVAAAQIHFNYNGTDHVHEYSQEIISKPTCTANGKKAFTCSCGESKEADYHYGTGKMLCYGGNYEWIDGSESDCSQMGKSSLCCTVCGNVFAKIDVAKDEHSMNITVSDTKVEYECTECGYSYTETIPSGARYVMFKTDDKERVYIYNPGDKVAMPASPQKDGFSFVGWKDEDGNVVNLYVMPDKNLVLSPLFEKTLVHDQYGVTASFDEDCFDVEDVSKIEFVVTEINRENEGGAVTFKDESGDLYEQIKLYNIKMMYNGSVIQPKNGKTVEIRMPVKGYEGRARYIVNHRFDDGRKERFIINNPSDYYDNGVIIFNASGFSEYEILAQAGAVLNNLPSKINYTYKVDSMDLSGIVIEITKSDGTKETVTDTSKMKVVGFDNTKIGTQIVTVECEDQIVQFEVSVSYAWWQWIIRILFLGFLWY